MASPLQQPNFPKMARAYGDISQELGLWPNMPAINGNDILTEIRALRNDMNIRFTNIDAQITNVKASITTR